MQPDAFVALKEIPKDHQGPISYVPELCIEVLSANRAYDRMTKRLVYAEAGVRELWTVEPDGRVERWTGERLSDSAISTDTLVSPLLPGFNLALAQLRA